MTNELKELINKKNQLITKKEECNLFKKELKKISKKFNTFFIALLEISVITTLPAFLYFTSILPKNISLDLLMTTAFIGGSGTLISFSTLLSVNILCLLPAKYILKIYSNKITKEKERINKKIIQEQEKNYNNQKLYSNTKKNTSSTNKKNTKKYFYKFDNSKSKTPINLKNDHIEKTKVKKLKTEH